MLLQKVRSSLCLGDYNNSENYARETYSHIKLVVKLIVFQLIYKITDVKYLQYKNIVIVI